MELKIHNYIQTKLPEALALLISEREQTIIRMDKEHRGALLVQAQKIQALEKAISEKNERLLQCRNGIELSLDEIRAENAGQNKLAKVEKILSNHWDVVFSREDDDLCEESCEGCDDCELPQRDTADGTES